MDNTTLFFFMGLATFIGVFNVDKEMYNTRELIKEQCTTAEETSVDLPT